MKGIIAADGKAYASAFLVRVPEITVTQEKISDPQAEYDCFLRAKERCSEHLEKLIDEASPDIADGSGEILDFQLLLLEDTDYLDTIAGYILNDHWNAVYAVSEASRAYQDELRSMDDNPYLQDRALDVGDLAKQLLCELLMIDADLREPDEKYIAVAKDLSPSQVASMNAEKLSGIILENGSLTEHAVIIAKSRGIPCLINVSGLMDRVKNGQKVLLDCFQGQVFENPSPCAIDDYNCYRRLQEQENEQLEHYRSCRTATTDGTVMKIFANIASWQETSELMAQGGEGVGLFRTELAFMNERSAPPTQEEQFGIYRRTAETLEGRPVIIRTLDVGGDKEIDYLGIPHEANPFLGYRAIRYCLDHEELFRTQLAAIVRASAYGKVAVMFPMISTVDEITRAREILDSVREELRRNEVAFDEQMKVGMMMETPAAAFDAKRFAGLVDFFSIGTNDLTQYLFAADRMNPSVSNLNTYFQPGLLRCVNHIVRCAHEAGIEVDICGQAGEVPELVPLWVGMHVDALSVSIPMIPKVRRRICNLCKSECEKLLNDVLQMDTSAQVRSALQLNRESERRGTY